MTTKTKRAAKTDGEKQQSAVERFTASAHPSLNRRATWIQYSPGGKLVRVNVEETLDDESAPGGQRIVRGHDVDIPIAECDADILAALTDALAWSAEILGAEVYSPEEE